MNWAAFEAISVGLSAVVAAIAFVISVIANRRDERRKRVQEWQRAVIHGIFHRRGNEELSFDSIKSLYRTEAAAYAEFKLTAEDVSDGSLRQILMGMIDTRVLDQNVDDRYTLSVSSLRMSQAVVGTMISSLVPLTKEQSQPALDDTRIADGIYSFVFDNNFKFSVPEIALQLAKDLTSEAGRVRTVLLRLIMHKILIVGNTGFVGVPNVRQLSKSAS